MNQEALFWLLIAIAAVGTFSLRFSFILLLERITEPPWFRRALKYLPPAIMSALVSSSLLIRDEQLSLGFDNPRLWAGLVAGLIGWFSRSLLWTILSGLGALAILNWLLGSS